MSDEFDRFLASALAPQERAPDRGFRARVEAAIALEEQFSAQRRTLIANFAEQLLGMFAVALGVWWVGRAAPVSNWFAESPALGLAILVTAFVCLVGLLSLRSGSKGVPPSLV